MAEKNYPNSGVPIRRTVELLPSIFQTPSNDKFLSGVLDPLVQPGVLDKITGYIGRRYGKTFNGSDVYIDSDNTLRSRYQLEPGVVYKNGETIENFYDYLDFKNQLKFFGNTDDRDDNITSQHHYSWNPPIDWDKFINYREYYWVPSGPPSVQIAGQSAKITSTYKVIVGTTGNSFVFTPDSYTNNPTITLYRGQTYKFKVNAPNEGFYIKTNYDTGSLLFVSGYGYPAGSLVVYDGKLWKAKRDINPGDGSSITIDSQDWEYVELASAGTALNYSKGITNNGIENGTLTFTVPYDAPDVLFYQSGITADMFGRFLISDISANTYINVDKELVGKSTYTSSNGISLSNGMIIEFIGQVSPSKYVNGSWLVEGVGTAITLTKFEDLIVPVLTTDVPEVLFDNEGFDSQPFDDATSYPTYKDYITIAKNSLDSNPWSRYNRWFHRSVLEQAYSLRGQDFPATESTRAKRPIIEFIANLQLINHGSISKQTVDYIDTFTTDVFSKIEGSTGYNVDGEFLFEGARLLVVADTDILTNNKIYEVTFITHNGRKQIHLKDSSDSISTLDECVLIRRGKINGGKMFHFNGTSWIESQSKTSVNQPPLFDVFDENEISFSDNSTYETSTFTGSKILSYKEGNGRIDSELGFSLSYLNIDNVGDIEFNWNWDTENFYYTENRVLKSKLISTGYYKINFPFEYRNGWTETNTEFIQPIVDSQIIKSSTTEITFKTVNWRLLTSEPNINFYINGKKYLGTWSRNIDTFTFSTSLSAGDVISIKLITDIPPDQGYYEIPVGLETNPLNSDLTTFTLGQALDHVITALDFNSEITGSVPGNSNLRDISNYQSYAKRFLKHSGLSPLVTMSLCDKTHNIIKSIQYAKKSYTDFKNNFLIRATEIEYNDNIPNFLDDIINSLTSTKNLASPFADSDMIGAGAYTSINYQVEDSGITTFSLNEKFNLTSLSRRAVYVYHNGGQLLHGRDYTFNSTFGFVTLTINLTEGDSVEIREYVSTATNHIPPTPTSMGMYKKYTPMKFVDDTYLEPREVIQGHDGSITAAFGDYRDDLLLELEYRIYNNIKKEYNPNIFDIDMVVGGYNNVGLYKKSQLDSVIAQEFLKWIQNTNINYTLNEYFNSENSFTYTYSNMTDPSRTQNLPGYWRGVYQWFYDTDRPHRCPWEMLGFTEKPTWWESQYGPAPYTRGNLLLWEDLRDGIVRQGEREGIYERYKRPTLMNHIPVDADGKLLSPLDSGLAQDFSLINNNGPFILGDVAPVEYAWRSSSEWPFAVTIAMCLMKPFEYITDNFNTSKLQTNKINQTVSVNTNKFIKIDDLILLDDDIAIGLTTYLISYIKFKGIDVDTLWNKISNLNVKLSYRMGGFVDQQQQKFLLDSKSPSATSSSIYVPPENYDIIFNVSSPISFVSYSGVILEKTEGGWLITGYDDIQPYFNYFQPVVGNKDPLISVGGVSETFIDWESDKLYNNGALVRFNTVFYRALKTHTSGSSFDNALWQKLAGIPKTGAVEAFKRNTFNTLVIKKLSYGSKLTSIQSVVDFLLGYESYLKSTGFVFDNYDPENKVSQDWLTSCKEFMFWTKQNWELGSLISLSPAAQKTNIIVPVGVADNILDGFYDYQVLKGDGKPLLPQYINVTRNFQNIEITTTNTTDGIYYLKLYYVLKEHVTIFDDRTVFNDIIYDPATGYRQGRIKVQGYRTTDWDGDYTSPGFLFDNVNIQPWMPYTDYKLGDIVSYKSFNWTSIANQIGTQTFNDAYWTKLDTAPTKSLVSNFDYKINSFYDYFEVSSDGIDQVSRDLSRHTVGYQQRSYLQNLASDPVTQFQIYQGFIREKGTSNSISKVFGKLSRSGSDSIVLNEEWAFLLGKIGGVDQLTEIEIQLEKNKFELNPQLFLIQDSAPSVKTNQNYTLTSDNFTIKASPYSTDINPTTIDIVPFKTAGYVGYDQITTTISSKDELLNLDITTINSNDHIWITFDNDSWDVLRVQDLTSLYVTDLSRKDTTIVTVTFNRPHTIINNDYVGFRNILNLTGFYKVIGITNTSIDVEVIATIKDPELDLSTTSYVTTFANARFKTYQDVDQRSAALLKNKSKLFVDNNGDNLWEVVEKNKQYYPKLINDYGTSEPLYAGSTVLYDNNYKNIFNAIPGSGFVTVYAEIDNNLSLKQIISPPNGFYNTALGSFGNSMAISPDGVYLIIAAPEASGVTTNYFEIWSPTVMYRAGDIVLYEGRLWRAINSNSALPDGSTTLAINTDDWELTTMIPVDNLGRSTGYYNQGMVAIYKQVNGRFTLETSFVSPRPTKDEKFGSSVSISVSGSEYYLAISAVGTLNNTGRVYMFKGTNSIWTGLENPSYKGIYNTTANYFAGDIVWQASQDPVVEGVRGSYWQAVEDQLGDGSTLTTDNGLWVKVGGISTDVSLPTSVSVEDDGSTLVSGMLTNTQIAEIVKEGDHFGFSLGMNRDGSILVIGAPYSDGQYFPNYRGIWRADIEYVEGDVVKHKPDETTSYIYYKLDYLTGVDSTYRSLGEVPSSTSVWTEISDSTVDPSGKVFVYNRNEAGYYQLVQMINSGSMTEFTDIDSNLIIASGDEFGYSVDLDSSGSTLVVSRPRSDRGYKDQGSVYVLNLDALTSTYRITQKLESYEDYPDEYFGYGVSISPDGSKIVVGAKNAPTVYRVNFDVLFGTYFDNGRTSFVDNQGYTGAVYVFDKKDDTFLLTEKLDTALQDNEGFGSSVDCVGSIVLVGSPYFRDKTTGAYVGNVRLFRKDSSVESWKILSQQAPVVDIRKIKSIELYDNIKNVKLQDIDYIDPPKGKILNIAEQEISFKTPYDPAIYVVGTDSVTVDSSVAWFEKNVGKVWWNISTAKWIYAEQDDYSFKLGNWNQLAVGSSIDVYEWVETPLLPSEWAALADTNEGLASGISGQPLYPNDDVYSIREFYNSNTGQVNETLYYYWVKNKNVIPANMPGRTRSISEITNLISNPSGAGISYIALIDSDKFVAYNFTSIMNSDTALLNIQYRNNLERQIPINTEYQLLTEGVADSLPAKKLEDKWIDSLVGFNSAGNRVPDTKLSAKQKYGINFRPRQSMFVDRVTALKIVVTNINAVLKQEPFVDLISFNNLNLVDEVPSSVLNLYDTVVDTDIDLQNVGTVRTKRAVLTANLVNGELDTIEIVEPGFGYRIVPKIILQGDGVDAAAVAELDNQGRIKSVTVTSRGKKYSKISAEVRYFSVLVTSDATIGGFWSIYSWDDSRKVFFRSQSQAYDTTKYWSYVDWWKEGYSFKSRIVREFNSIFEEEFFNVDIGDLIRIKEYNNGGWAVFEKLSDTGLTFLERYVLVGRQNGTVELSSSIYDSSVLGIGFDNTESYDDTNYDLDNSKELRNILRAVKEDIFIGNYQTEWNKLFFASMRYVLSEQQYVDWMFKTSFLNAIHNVGSFEQTVNYKNDNLESFQDYINEVKPFRTTVREYISKYDTVENCNSITMDFDLPPTYSQTEGRISPINSDNSLLNVYPWKAWTDHHGYSISSINVFEPGEKYTSVPTVIIDGNGTGATAQAYISNGKVSGILVTNGGYGYTVSPSVTLVGGNPSTAATAKATAVLGDSKVRTFNMAIKFDRISKTGIYQNYIFDEQLIPDGRTSVFELSYAPSRDKTKTTVYKNGQLVLSSDYTITLYYSKNDSYPLLRGRITFVEVPLMTDEILINYEKNIEILDAVNRVDKYYSPTSGMVGKELNQLMTGIDFGGVQIQGTTFEVTGGWDALPWFTDNWDSVESSSDYYHICDDNTDSVTLPYVPANGQQITIYIKRNGSKVYGGLLTDDNNFVTKEVDIIDPQPIRIDDPNYTDNWDSSSIINPNAEMPTFVGDGQTATIEIGRYIETYKGDVLIFRPIESDGSVTITDDNLVDTLLSGGTLSAVGSTATKVANNTIDGMYAYATGTSAEDISIDGGKFISPEHVPATEENVPGQVLDSVSIKVYNNTISGSAPLQSKIIVSDGITTDYYIGQNILESKSAFVYVDKIKQIHKIDYTIDIDTNVVQFNSSPLAGSIIEILSIGLGGLGILDYQEFVADGTTNLFLTNANYDDTSSVFVTVNGEQVNVGFKNSSDVIDAVGKTIIEFGIKPNKDDIIKIVCLESSSDVDLSGVSIIKVNTQTLYYEGSTRSFDLNDFAELSRGTARNSMIVEINGKILKGSDTTYTIYDGSNNSFILGVDPYESPGTILPSNIRVFINNVLRTFITDYVYDGTSKVLTINESSLNVGDIIKIQNDIRSEYRIDGNNIIIDDSVTLTYTDETDNTEINVTWFSEYPTLDVIYDQKTGGKVQYQLSRSPISVSYVWVYKNGTRLIQNNEYSVSLPRSVVYLNVETTPSDIIQIISFSNAIYKLPSAFEIHKDMLNIYHYNRFSKDEIKLSVELPYYSDTITVDDSTSLTDPIPSRNIPGIIWIMGERIEYMKKEGNVLSQLRRGSQGTSTKEVYPIGTAVVNVGYTDIIPYNETQDRIDFYSDGSTPLIGPLEYIPTQGNRTSSWYRDLIPDEYGPCDQIEVFAAGRRLRKDPINVWDESNGAYSPVADTTIEAEFSVDGISPYIRLTEPLPAGTRITIIKRTGKTWYDRGQNTASAGVTLLDNNSPIAKFIAQKTTSIPE